MYAGLPWPWSGQCDGTGSTAQRVASNPGRANDASSASAVADSRNRHAPPRFTRRASDTAVHALGLSAPVLGDTSS